MGDSRAGDQETPETQETMAYVEMDERPRVSGHYHLATPVEEITLKNKDENLTLWGPDIRPFLKGPDWTCEGVDTWDLPVPREMFAELCKESGMDWDSGPYRDKVLKAIEELEDPKESIQDPEIAQALDQWRKGEEKPVDMDDLHEPSLFTEWNQGEECSTWVGAGEIGKNMKIPEYTPEMLAQREELNWAFNFLWNTTFYPGDTVTTVVPEVEIEMEIVAAGDSHAVAKCKYGSAFIPKGALKHIINLNYGRRDNHYLEIHKHRSEGGLVGEFIWGRVQFTPGKRHWWRVVQVDCVTE